MMIDIVDGLLDSICHRGGEHAGLLPLCLRCSGVYAGVLVGAAFEAALRSLTRRGPGVGALLLNVFGLALMGVVGVGDLYDLFATPAGVKVFAALFFGSAVAFFAVSAVAVELRAGSLGRGNSLWGRAAVLLFFALWAALASAGDVRALRPLGVAAGAGIAVAFIAVNLALALVLFRRVGRRSSRVALSCLCIVPMAAAEFAVFSLWRSF